MGGVHHRWCSFADWRRMMSAAATAWVVDALRPADADVDGWVEDYACQPFTTEADALRWLDTYRPYIGAADYRTRAIAA
ncbi:hypothetical protein [Ralstonia solanacearum]|uniref:hypothetical protein n=1 Tax=Ralstonia solanacearum TaxID=305 RepID=UPI003D803864